MISIDLDCSGPKFSDLPQIIREHNCALNLSRNPIELEEILEALEILPILDDVLALIRQGQSEQAHDKLNRLIHPAYNRAAFAPASEVA